MIYWPSKLGLLLKLYDARAPINLEVPMNDSFNGRL